MKRILKYILRFFLILLAILLILPALLYVSGIQNFAKNKATEILSQKTGWDITVEKVRLKFPLRLTIKDVSALTSQKDTLLHLGALETGIALKPLLRKEVQIKSFVLQNG